MIPSKAATTGSEGLQKSSGPYAVEQLRKANLQPAGSNGFYQARAFQSISGRRSQILLGPWSRGGQAQISLFSPDDAYINTTRHAHFRHAHRAFWFLSATACKSLKKISMNSPAST